MKNYIIRYLFISSILLVIIACGRDMVGADIVDTDNQPGETFIKTDASAKAAVSGMYNNMQNRYVYGGELHFFEGLFADDFTHTGTFSEFAEAGASNFLDSNLSIRRIYGSHYTAIRTSNIIIDQVEINPVSGNTITMPIKNQVLGEAYAGRALMYFNLVRLFGDVAYVTRPIYTAAEIITPRRDSRDDVYRQIIDDLKKAIEYFTASNNTSKIFLNLDASKVILAKVYMEIGLYEDARLLLESITGYNLVANYETLFTPNATTEDIFKINFTSTDTGNQAFFFYPAAVGGRGEVSLRPEFINIFDANDKRKMFDIAQSRNYFKKYNNPGTGADNIQIIRYADVLLSLAECRLKTTGDAITPINQVRIRAGISPLISVTLDDILLERRKEFYGEADRWFSVKRFGMAKQIIESKGRPYLSQRLDLWPIPSWQINNNPNTIQNPGY
ncbi:RagB/SusD family nutrient uptake outer membrane protein [Elizabethkingia anophelis]|uniref:RagB/SusD family nutrient uptake outer membrane protein n=1 Tax=Elizabethkingia anophelis TaxID=1117645 RepID=UPI000C6EE2CC|nr:RagB/SusD family nutrient uptake outer membrane protein [Elizabethkingia anophelis]PKR32358.1 RagB/SusD family nutrient uptake outer membrane protein [Elizabethkingia anophelis]PKR34011.1 RagB/SusD family nutrient uptake outer membrane protein [Elizabethkingia anophelis]PRQ79156.1 RagB/SusD family nutrient uptake outer membrane protein [Elizabethkingia anophelis]PRQ83184.1 RagB/SusD family nutrient uptake outer membrane protein [Elizabethkingia anophelis]PRQ88461.1 RagB/SusD family nutrient